MSVKRQHFLLSYLKTLSVDPAKVFQRPTSYTAGLQITAGQRTKIGFVRSFTLVRKKNRVSSFKYLKVQFYYYRCFVRPKMGYVRAKIGLTGQFDWRQPGNYLQPCTVVWCSTNWANWSALTSQMWNEVYRNIKSAVRILLNQLNYSCKEGILMFVLIQKTQTPNHLWMSI